MKKAIADYTKTIEMNPQFADALPEPGSCLRAITRTCTCDRGLHEND